MKMKTPKFAFVVVTAIALLSSCGGDEDKPQTLPTVSTNSSIMTTATSAIVSGVVSDDGNSKITEAGFVYSSTVDEPTIADNKKIVDDIDSFEVELTGLTSATTYNVRAYAINKKGTAYGEKRTFETGNLAPSVTNVSITGVVEVGKSIEAVYLYTDAEDDDEGPTSFQWYEATTSTGENEALIVGATEKTFTIGDGQNGKFLRVSVVPKAATGTPEGVEVKSGFSNAVGSETVTFNYGGGDAVTYGTILSATTGRKWLDRNLGATKVAETINDYMAYGDLFQWGRTTDGHQLITRTGPNDANASQVTGATSTTAPYETSADDTPETNKFIVVKGSGSPLDWRSPQDPNTMLWQGVSGINNPCPSGWRLPTKDEWVAEGFTSGANAFEKLRLPYTGQRSNRTGDVALSAFGLYWSSTGQESTGTPGIYVSIYLVFDANTVYNISTSTTNRAYGQACRCIKN